MMENSDTSQRFLSALSRLSHLSANQTKSRSHTYTNTFHSLWKEYIFQSPIITWRPSEVILQPPWGLPTLSLGIADMENKKIHYYFTPLTFTSSFFSPVLQRYSVVTQLHLLMAVFPVWMAQLSPTPLCIHVWRDICSPAHPHASVWQMAHGLAWLQTAQVSLVYTET